MARSLHLGKGTCTQASSAAHALVAAGPLVRPLKCQVLYLALLL